MISFKCDNYQLIYAPDFSNIFILEDTADELRTYRVKDLDVVGKCLMYQFNVIYGI